MESIDNIFNSKSNNVSRLLGSIKGNRKSPTVIIFAGIHGNEIAGVKASRAILKSIKANNIPFKGNLYIILGNINALKKGVRFEHIDLNRIWKQENISKLYKDVATQNAEEKEQTEIYYCIKNILKNNSGPFYFLDLHTTSSSTIPFITISDSLNNRKFSSNFPVPIVLGIEEYLDGPLLTYINEFGHVALGFEAGEHHDKESIKKSKAFIWTALVCSKCILKKNLPEYKKYKNMLSEAYYKDVYFEIVYKYTLSENENFKMHKGFHNFEVIAKNQGLAQSNGKDIKANIDGLIFMPLYQELGEDGYFILNRISSFWLYASIFARTIKINHFLRIIPGVRIDQNSKYGLIVNPKIARFLAKDIFHLLGYRKKIFKNGKLYFTKRDRKITNFE